MTSLLTVPVTGVAAELGAHGVKDNENSQNEQGGFHVAPALPFDIPIAVEGMEGAVGGVAEFPNQRRGAQPLHGGPFFHQARNQQQQKNEGRRPAEQRKKVIAYPFVPSLFKGGGVYVLLPDSFQAGHGVCVAALADFFLGDAHLGGRVREQRHAAHCP